jgi:hypothetical protein
VSGRCTHASIHVCHSMCLSWSDFSITSGFGCSCSTVQVNNQNISRQRQGTPLAPCSYVAFTKSFHMSLGGIPGNVPMRHGAYSPAVDELAVVMDVCEESHERKCLQKGRERLFVLLVGLVLRSSMDGCFSLSLRRLFKRSLSRKFMV